MDGFEDLGVWQRSSPLCVELYRELKNSREWGFRDQITRSALSVPSNIAVGYERNSRKEYVQFLRIAKGSCGEMRTQLQIGKQAGLIGSARAEDFIKEATAIGRMLGAMIGKLSRDQT
jgi:four helix bundle protein